MTPLLKPPKMRLFMLALLRIIIMCIK